MLGLSPSGCTGYCVIQHGAGGRIDQSDKSGGSSIMIDQAGGGWMQEVTGEAISHWRSYLTLDKLPHTGEYLTLGKLPHNGEAISQWRSYLTMEKLSHTEEEATLHWRRYLTMEKLPHIGEPYSHWTGDLTMERLPLNGEVCQRLGRQRGRGRCGPRCLVIDNISNHREMSFSCSWSMLM